MLYGGLFFCYNGIRKGRGECVYALFIVLNETQYLSEILTSLQHLGIRGATVINTRGSRRIQEDEEEASILFKMIQSLQGHTKDNRTIFSVIEKDEQIHDAMKNIEGILGGDMTVPNKGIMFVLPVTHFRGGDLQRHIDKHRDDYQVVDEED